MALVNHEQEVSLVRKSFKYRIYPTKYQITNIENQFSMCRYLYNWSLKERIETYEKKQKSISYYDQANNLPDLKKEKPWFKGVYGQVLQQVLKRLDLAFQAFFRRIKEGDIPGFPKFKKKGEWDSILYPQYSERPEDNKIAVSKIGEIKIKYHREIPENAKIKTLAITKEGFKWFACFSVEYPFECEHKCGNTIYGIDLGLIDFYYGSDGESISVPKFFRKSERKLQIAQRKLSKTEKRTPKYRKHLRIVQRIHYKIKCQRRDFLHKAANYLLTKADNIVIEKLNIQGMSHRPKPKQDDNGSYLKNGAARKVGLNKSISDVGWYSFFLMLKYKAEVLGKKILEVAPHYTSQECSGCGNIVQKSLSTRTHKCTECGLQLNRDHNAAINIKRLATQSLELIPKSLRFQSEGC